MNNDAETPETDDGRRLRARLQIDECAKRIRDYAEFVTAFAERAAKRAAAATTTGEVMNTLATLDGAQRDMWDIALAINPNADADAAEIVARRNFSGLATKPDLFKVRAWADGLGWVGVRTDKAHPGGNERGEYGDFDTAREHALALQARDDAWMLNTPIDRRRVSIWRDERPVWQSPFVSGS